MSLPEMLTEALGDESVVAEVSLGGEDVLVVTPTRTVVYRADGLLSDESTASYGHEVERLSMTTGRRKAKLTLEYGLDGTKKLAVPVSRVDAVLHPMMAGILSAMGVTESGEAVQKTFRFSDLTLVITSHRLVKHIGSAVWSTEYEAFAYSDLTNLDFEEGNVATTIVLTHDGRQERLKAPNDEARAVREALTEAVCSFHDVESLAQLRSQFGDDTADEPADVDRFDFGAGPDPLSAEPAAAADADAETDPQTATISTEATNAGDTTDADSTVGVAVDTDTTVDTVAGADADDVDKGTNESAGSSAATTNSAGVSGTSGTASADADDDHAALDARLDELTDAVEQQERELARQSELIETLIEELRRGR